MRKSVQCASPPQDMHFVHSFESKITNYQSLSQFGFYIAVCRCKISLLYKYKLKSNCLKLRSKVGIAVLNGKLNKSIRNNDNTLRLEQEQLLSESVGSFPGLGISCNTPCHHPV